MIDDVKEIRERQIIHGFFPTQSFEVVASKDNVGSPEGTAIGKAITYKYRQLSIMT
jgi:hypothetical protein